MFKKLLKYDMKSVSAIWCVAALSVIALSLVGSFSLRFFSANANEPDLVIFNLLAMLFFIISLVGISALSIITFVLIFWRFYKNFFTDEGYLTFTLPVSRKKLLLSKTANAFIWSSLQSLVIYICLAIFFLLAVPMEKGGAFINLRVYKLIGDLVSSLWNGIGAGWFIVYVLEIILLAAASIFFSISLTHLCITVGSTVVKKAKLVVSIGLYYLSNLLASWFYQIFGWIGFYVLTEGFTELLGGAAAGTVQLVVVIILLLVAVVLATIGSIAYMTTQNILDRRLNLA